MNITIINGTNRIGNKTEAISRAMKEIAQKSGHDTAIVDLSHFTDLFHGDYITHASATDAQRQDVRALALSDLLFFVVPTYHAGIPSPLKNFFDILKCADCYADKVIGIIASNNHGQDVGARQTREVLNGILSFQKARSILVPRITVIDHDHIDEARLADYLQFSQSFVHEREAKMTEGRQSYLNHWV